VWRTVGEEDVFVRRNGRFVAISNHAQFVITTLQQHRRSNSYSRCFSTCSSHPQTHKHHFQGKPGLAGFPLILVSNDPYSEHPRGTYSPKLFIHVSSLTQSHRVFLGHPLHQVPSFSIFIQRLSQSATSLRLTFPNHRNLLFLKSYLIESILMIFFLF